LTPYRLLGGAIRLLYDALTSFPPGLDAMVPRVCHELVDDLQGSTTSF